MLHMYAGDLQQIVAVGIWIYKEQVCQNLTELVQVDTTSLETKRAAFNFLCAHIQ